MKAIYAIINKITGKRYIGSAVDFYGRKRTHLCYLRLKKHHSSYLQNSYNKYGEENFEFIILEKIENKEDLIPREQWWIDNTPSEYNCCKIAGSSLGVKRTEKTKEKIRQANLGLKHPEWRNKIKSEAQGGINHWQYGKKMSEEVKKKKSEAMKKYYAKGYSKSNSKKIEQLDLLDNHIAYFKSINEAANHEKARAKNISRALKSKSNIAYGYKWKVAEG